MVFHGHSHDIIIYQEKTVDVIIFPFSNPSQYLLVKQADEGYFARDIRPTKLHNHIIVILYHTHSKTNQGCIWLVICHTQLKSDINNELLYI